MIRGPLQRTLVLASLALGGGVIGCGDASEPVDQAAPAPAPASTQRESGPTPAQLKARREEYRRQFLAEEAQRERAAEGVVRDFYAEVLGQEYDQAWSRLTPTTQANLSGSTTWKKGYEQTVDLTATANAVMTGDSSSRVRVTLASEDLDDCGDTVHQRFAGNWTVVRRAGRWLLDSQNMYRTAGHLPVRECPDDTVPPGDDLSDLPDSEEPDPGDYNDPDTGPPDSDVPSSPHSPPTTEDFGQGKGSTGLCEDGTLSDSIGRSGACSHHGGIR